MEMYNPPHPGEMLREFMDDLTVTQLAEDLGVTRPSLSKLLSPEMALSLEKAFPCTSVTMWLGWQNDYDLWQLKHKD